MITEEVVADIAWVEVNDDYRVELHQIRKGVDYNPTQARQLAAELVAAADKAENLLEQSIEEARHRAADTVPVVTEAGDVVF